MPKFIKPEPPEDLIVLTEKALKAVIKLAENSTAISVYLSNLLFTPVVRYVPTFEGYYWDPQIRVQVKKGGIDLGLYNPELIWDATDDREIGAETMLAELAAVIKERSEGNSPEAIEFRKAINGH